MNPPTPADLIAEGLLARLRGLKNPLNIAGQRRFGITPSTEQLGVSMAVLRKLARPHRKNHDLAVRLWASGVHEGRILAALVENPAAVTRAQANAWARDLDSWDICDQVCGEVFAYTRFAFPLALTWCSRKSEFVKRAGFVTITRMAVRRKDVADEVFADFLPIITRHAEDERNFVRKAVNWALRQIGKRSPALRRRAITQAKNIAQLDSPSARWVASDALRELS